MVTGIDFMAVKIPIKSLRCSGRSFLSATLRSDLFSARIISRIAIIRSPSKNMCSVRQRPMPWAPKSRARRASAGVSALVRTSMVRYLSDHFITVAKSSESLGVCVAISPTITSPVEPSIDSTSLWVNVLPPTLILRAFASIRISPAPATQQRPQPRATTAAWLVI